MHPGYYFIGKLDRNRLESCAGTGGQTANWNCHRKTNRLRLRGPGRGEAVHVQLQTSARGGGVPFFQLVKS